jgi:hypothetical protein
MDLSHLRAAQPQLLLEAVEGINRVRDALTNLGDRLRTAVRVPLAAGTWTGEASTAAERHVGRVEKDLADMIDTVGRVGNGVMRFADALVDAQSLVAKADAIAARQRLQIGDDGSIHFPSFATPSSDAEQISMRAAAEEAHRILGSALAIAAEADSACAGVLTSAGPLAGALGAAVGSALAAGPSGGDGAGGGEGGPWNTLTGLFDDRSRDFDDSALGHLVEGWTDDDRSIWERAWLDQDGPLDPFGELEPWEEELLDEAFGTTPDELFGSEVVETAHEDGVAAGIGEWWDQSWEDVTNVPDRIREGWNDFTDDPVGTVTGLFRG